MRLLNIFTYVTILLLVVFTSCNDDEDNTFSGAVTVTLISQGSVEATEGEATSFVFDVVLSRSFDTAIELVFDAEGLEDFDNILDLENSVTIAPNTTTSTFTITTPAKPDSGNELTEDQVFEIRLESVTGIDNEVTLAESVSVKVNFEEDFMVLTDAQKALLEGYKSRGIDLTPWIGKIPVEVTVKTDGLGLFEPFDTESTKTYSGITFITLSEKATADKPLLVMTKNAFGLAEYLQFVFREETIENTLFWYDPTNEFVNPAGKEVIKAIGVAREQMWIDKEYDFDVMVDSIEFNSDNTINFVYENGTYDIYADFMDPEQARELSAVDFQYSFELWDELASLADGNPELTDHILSGGSLHPNNYIGLSTILEDDWFEKNWVEPTGTYDNEAKTMSFTFNTDHSNSGDYDIVTVTFKSPF